MKTQFSFQKSGFTLIELMVVIAIIGLLFMVFSRFTYQPQEHLIRAERLANKISSVLHSGLLQITIGKMDNANPPKAVTGAIISFGTNACPAVSGGSGITWYYTPTSSGQLRPPFFDTDRGYEIESIAWSGGTTPGTGECISIIMNRDAIAFSGSSMDPSNTIVVFTAKYITMRKKVLFDRRTGRVEVNKN